MENNRLRSWVSVEQVVEQHSVNAGDVNSEADEVESVLTLQKAVYLEELSKSSRDLRGQEQELEEEKHFDTFLCTCGTALAVPEETNIFRCFSCQQVLTRPKFTAPAQQDTAEDMMQCLQKWVVREAVSRHFDAWLEGSWEFSGDLDTLLGRLYNKIHTFPFFAQDSEQVDKAFFEVFKLMPEIEKHMRHGGRKGFRNRLVKLVASPILYASQQKETVTDNDNVHNAYRQSIITFLNSLSEVSTTEHSNSANGLEKFIHLLKRCHSISEIGGNFQQCALLQAQAAVDSIEYSMAKKSSRSKLQTIYRIFPSFVFLKMIKAGIGSGGVSGLTTKLLLTKPLGGLSLLQRLVYEVLAVDSFKKKAKILKGSLPSAIQRRCELFLREKVAFETVEAMKTEELVRRFITGTNEAIEHDTIANVRGYLMMECQVQELRLLVQVSGDDRVCNLYKVVVKVCQERMFKDITAKGSGYIRMIEAILMGWRNIINTAKDKTLDRNAKRHIYFNIYTNIQSAAFTLIHNVLQNDRNNTWHNLLYWLVNNWNASKIDVDFIQEFTKMSEEKKQAIMKDAQKLKEREKANANRQPGTAKQPVPKVENCDELVKTISHKLLIQALPTDDQIKHSESYLSPENTRMNSPRPNATQQFTDNDVLYFLEVAREHDNTVQLRNHGYTKLQTPLVENCYLWMKRQKDPESGEMYKTGEKEVGEIGPICDIRIVVNSEEDTALIRQGYVKIWKKLNTRGSGDIYIWYKRSVDALTESISDVRAVNSEDEKTAFNLISNNYVLLNNEITKKKKTSGGTHSSMTKWYYNDVVTQLWVKKAPKAPLSSMPMKR